MSLRKSCKIYIFGTKREFVFSSSVDFQQLSKNAMHQYIYITRTTSDFYLSNVDFDQMFIASIRAYNIIALRMLPLFKPISYFTYLPIICIIYLHLSLDFCFSIFVVDSVLFFLSHLLNSYATNADLEYDRQSNPYPINMSKNFTYSIALGSCCCCCCCSAYSFCFFSGHSSHKHMPYEHFII